MPATTLDQPLADALARLAGCVRPQREIDAAMIQRDRDRALLRRDEARRDWRARVPEEYRAATWEHARLDPAVRALCRRWNPASRRGLLLIGKSGLGKTCGLTLCLRRARLCGYRVLWVRHAELADAAALAHRPGADGRQRAEAAALLHRAEHDDVVLLDDLGKGAETPRAQEAVANLIEIRTAAGRPVLVSAQGGSAWLTARLGPDRGKATVRRLRDFCARAPLERDFALEPPPAA